MKYSLISLLWDDNIGEGVVKLTKFNDAGWVTKMDFLNDVIGQLEDLRDETFKDYKKPEGSYRF